MCWGSELNRGLVRSRNTGSKFFQTSVWWISLKDSSNWKCISVVFVSELAVAVSFKCFKNLMTYKSKELNLKKKCRLKGKGFCHTFRFNEHTWHVVENAISDATEYYLSEFLIFLLNVSFYEFNAIFRVIILTVSV